MFHSRKGLEAAEDYVALAQSDPVADVHLPPMSLLLLHSPR